MNYEYYLEAWGNVFDDDLVLRKLRINTKEFWFTSLQERIQFQYVLENFSKRHKRTVFFRVEEGRETRLRTIANLLYLLPNGDWVFCKEDYGFARDIKDIKYRLTDGSESTNSYIIPLLSSKGYRLPPHLQEPIKLMGMYVIKEECVSHKLD